MATAPTFTPVPATRADGEGNPPIDMNNTSNELAAIGATYSVMNTAYSGGANPNTAADSSAAFAAALAALPGSGGVVLAPAGTFSMQNASALAMSIPGSHLVGAGRGATVLQISGSLSAAQVIAITANFCSVSSLSIVGASSTVTSNPAANAIELTGAQFCTIDAEFQYVNGWTIESVGGTAVANTGCRFINPTGYNCGGGVHIKGVTGSSFGGQQWITNPHFSQIGTSATNLDAIMIEDASDIYISSPDGAISDVGTGSTLHIKGLCTSVFVDDFDLGVFPNGSPNNSVLTIEDSANGSPSGIHFNTGILQEALVAATVSGGATRVYFSETDFANSSTHGVTLSGSGSSIYFDNCTWRGNGAGASGANYDLNVTSTATGKVRGSRFLTTVTGMGTAGVQAVVNLSSSGQNIPFVDSDFVGAGVALSTVFQSNLPAYVRNCKGYNPHGSQAVTYPGSGTATTGLHYDSMFYITAGTAPVSVVKNTAGQGGGAGPTVTIPANQLASVFVPAQATITPTGATPPIWVVDGL